jgi:hypothetical protein
MNAWSKSTRLLKPPTFDRTQWPALSIDPAAVAMSLAVVDAAAILVAVLAADAAVAMLLHAAIVSGAAALALNGPTARDPLVWLGLVGWLAAGPVAAVSILLMSKANDRVADGASDLESWYRSLMAEPETGDSQALFDSLASARIVPAASQGEAIDFPTLLSHGTLEQRQALLGLIGLRYHPSFRPLLSAALRNAEPSVRTQAAAVHVKLRAEYQRRLIAALEGDGDQSHRIRIIRECLETGFIEPPASTEARARADMLAAEVIAPTGTGPSDDRRGRS